MNKGDRRKRKESILRLKKRLARKKKWLIPFNTIARFKE